MMDFDSWDRPMVGDHYYCNFGFDSLMGLARNSYWKIGNAVVDVAAFVGKVVVVVVALAVADNVVDFVVVVVEYFDVADIADDVADSDDEPVVVVVAPEFFVFVAGKIDR